MAVWWLFVEIVIIFKAYLQIKNTILNFTLYRYVEGTLMVLYEVHSTYLLHNY